MADVANDREDRLETTTWKGAAIGIVLISMSSQGIVECLTDSQDRRMFGVWIVESGASETGPRVPICGRECEITAEGNAVVVVAPVDGEVSRYRTDGEPVDVTFDAFGLKTEMRTRVRWSGPVLEISRATRSDGSEGVESRVTLSIEAGKLVISSDVGRGGPGRAVYRRK